MNTSWLNFEGLFKFCEFNQQENAVNSAPWTVDPCGDKAVQEYWRIFEGNLNSYWEHQSNHLAFVISFSKVEYGEVCKSENQHICPKFR